MQSLQKYNSINDKPIKSTTLTGRSLNILYGKASDNELLEYKAIFDNNLATIALSMGRGLLPFSERLGEEIYNEIRKYPIRKYLAKNYPNLTKDQKKSPGT